MNDYKSHCIKVAGMLALIGNALLALIKLTLGSLAHSLAVVGDGIDSSTDVLIAIVTLIIGSIIAQPSDKEHPWGHGRAETTATMALSFIIFFAGAQLVMQSVTKLAHGSFGSDESTIAIIASLISIGGKSVLSLLQYHYGNLANSDIVKANAANMKNDIIMSAAVLVGLASSKLLHCPILDPIIALLVGLWIIKNAAVLFFDMNMELMDGNPDSTLYTKLFEASQSVDGVKNPHAARIRKIASHYDIDLDIEAKPTLTLFEAHELSEKVEEAIREAISDVYTITIHIEPEGSSAHQRVEEYGLTPTTLNYSTKPSGTKPSR